MKRIRLVTGLAATLALVAVLAARAGGNVGRTAVTAAPGDNAVVHWSEVARGDRHRRRALRPPASSAVLGGHGSRGDVRRRRRDRQEARAVRDQGDGAAGRIEGRRRRAGRARRARRPRAAAGRERSRPPTTRTWRRFRTGPRRTRAWPWAPPRRPACSRCGPRDGFDDNVPYVQPPPGPACSSRSRRRSLVDRRSCSRAAVHVRRRPAYRPGAPVRADEQAVRHGRGGAAGARPRRQRRSNAAQTETVRFHGEPTYFQFSGTLREARERAAGSTCASRRDCSATRGSRSRTR